MPCSARFTPEKETRYPWYRKLVGPQDRSERVRKISLLPGFDPQTVQPVASRYTFFYVRHSRCVEYKLKYNIKNI